MTRKCLLAWMLALFAGVLSGCGQKSETSWTAAQMAEAILAVQDGVDSVEQAAYGEASFTDYLNNYYRLDPQTVADGSVLYVGGASATEIAVLRMTGSKPAEEAVQRLEQYIQERTGAFTGYLPEEAAVLEQSTAVRTGDYVALLICGNQQGAKDAFQKCFDGTEPPAASVGPKPVEEKPEPADAAPEPAEPEAAPDAPPDDAPAPDEAEPSQSEQTPPPEVPASSMEPVPAPDPEPASEPAPEPEPTPEPKPEPDTPWSYDKDRLVSAWSAGDWSKLHQRDREILDICNDVIAPLSGLSAYDQELAVHDWMIAWGSYDSDTLSHGQSAEPNPDHDNPYGFLIGKKGICLGYTSTFQLFMDLPGIECLTIFGPAYSKTQEHAWNMVRLDGEWYCVDVTWDDPTTYGSVSKTTAHRYFNVTSEYLRGRDHQWDASAVSEATATKYAWNPYA